LKVLVILFSLMVGTAWADVPQLINYQGQLTDVNGQNKNGSVSLTFSVYDAALEGNLMWGPETHGTATLVNGRFNVILGSMAPDIQNAFVNGEAYLEIAEGGNVLKPRQQILSAPYAISSQMVAPGAISFESLSPALQARIVNLENKNSNIKFNEIVNSSVIALGVSRNNSVTIDELTTSITTVGSDAKVLYIAKLSYEANDDDFVFILERTANGQTVELGVPLDVGNRNKGISAADYDADFNSTMTNQTITYLDQLTVEENTEVVYRLKMYSGSSGRTVTLNGTANQSNAFNFERATSHVILKEF